MVFTTHAIEMMGYTEYPEEDSLEILFGILRVFSIKGINFEKECEMPRTEVVPFGENCAIVIANSLNDASLLLTGDVFTDEEEEKWISKKKINPPFLIVYFKESATRTLQGGYRQEKGENIYLYDGFPEGKIEIKAWEKEKLPNIVTSLTIQLSSKEVPVELVPAVRTIFGKTAEGANVFDLKMTVGPVQLSVSKSHKVENINLSLQESSSLYSKLTINTTRYLYSAFNEKDKLKQFLSYFLFIERYTHSRYKALSSDLNLSDLVNVPSRLQSSGSAFFESQFEISKNLSQRFHWCALMEWENIDDTDIAFFREAKSLRDKISHGDEYDEAVLPVQELRMLSLKLLGAT